MPNLFHVHIVNGGDKLYQKAARRAIAAISKCCPVLAPTSIQEPSLLTKAMMRKAIGKLRESAASARLSLIAPTRLISPSFSPSFFIGRALIEQMMGKIKRVKRIA